MPLQSAAGRLSGGYAPTRTPTTTPCPSLPSWSDCPTASEYAPRDATESVPLAHRTFCRALLFVSAEYEGGAVILLTSFGGVFSLPHECDDDLAHEWEQTLAHYAGERVVLVA